MQKITANELTHDGLRWIKVIGDEAIDAELYLRRVPLVAHKHVTLVPALDNLLGLHSLVIKYPVYGPYKVAIHSHKKFRTLMFVHTVYARRVSECIDLARIEFFAGTRFAPRFAFAQSLPEGAKDGMDVHSCVFLAADWMPANCVATGGCDVY